MFIQTESTPNPATMKFIPGVEVLPSGTANFTDHSQAMASPLAHRLFGVGGIDGVFFAEDFVTVTKTDAESWDELRPVVLAALMDHFNSGEPVMGGEGSARGSGFEEEDVAEADREIVAQIKEILDSRVRPAVAQDGGDIIFRGFRDGVVRLHMQGSCRGCPSSTATLRHGIENMLKHYVPEVQGIEAV